MTVNVAAVNDAPVAINDTLAATEDTPVTYTAAQLLGNDTDVDGDTLTIASVTSGTGGTAVLNANGTVTFTPDANFNGAASFSYTVTDGTATSNTATVTVNVDGGQRRAGCGQRHAGGDRRHAGHLHGGAAAGQRHRRRRRHAVDRLGDAAGTGGTAVLNGNGTVTFTPDGELQRRGELHLHGDRRHGAPATPATVTVTVAAVNDAPVAIDDTLAATEDTPVTYTAAQLLGNDTDVDGDTLSIASVTQRRRRHRGAQRQRHGDLHAERQLQRRGELQLHGDRRHGGPATPRR